MGETRLGLDAPPGFADTGFTGSPRLQELAESLTSASNRILLFAISDADLRRFTVGDRPDFRRFMLVATPKELERDRVAQANFGQWVGDALRELGPPSSAAKSYAETLDTLPPGKPGVLAELRREPDVVSMLQGVRVAPQARGEKPQYLLSTNTWMLVRGKALNLAVYSAYEAASDLEWIRSITARWIEELQRLNAR